MMHEYSKSHFTIHALIILVVGIISISDHYFWTFTGIPWIPILVTLMGLKMLFYSAGYCRYETTKKPVRKTTKKKTKKKKRKR